MQLRKLFMLMAFATVSACGGGGGGSQNPSNSSSSSVTNRSPIISVAPNQRVLEGSKTVVVISASDADGDALTYEISGDDKSVFLITADGTLVFEDSPDYEAPLDIDRDNVYSITINVSDNKATDSVSLLIEIIDGLEIRVIDSPMRGAEVSLIDANTGLSVDGLSPASTNEDGFVFFEVPEFFSGAQVVSRGGVDSFTNRPLPELMLKSEVSNNRSVVQTVNAITTLMVASQNSSNRQAILDVLGITIPLSDIFERDIWAEALEGRDDALQAQQVNAQLSLLFLVGGALNRSSSEEAINSLVSRLVSLVDANIPFSLSDPDTLQVLLESVDVDESVNQRIIMEVVDVLADIETLLGASALSPVSNDALQIIEVVQLRVPGSVAALVTGELVLSEFQALMTPVSLFEQVVVSNNSQDTDGDGLVDILDPDDDGDGVRDDVDFFPNNTAEALDTDRDGLGNNQDLDDDNDGIADLFDDLPEDATESIDSDGDGVGNNRDPDDDNDGVLDTFDDDPLVSSLDRDGDGVPDIIDAYPVDPRNYLDSDGDGVFDLFDVFPLNSSQVKALKFEFSGVVAAGYSEKIRNVDAIEPSPNNVLSIGPRKKSQKFTNVDGPSARFNSGPAGDVLLVDQSNVVTWGATGDEVSNVILSSETMFVVESMLSPDGKYLYLLSPKAIQDEIEQRGTQDIEVDNCQLYKVDLSDDTFLCLMDEGAPAIESSLTSITWRDDYLRRALSFRADGLAIADSSDGPLLLRQDGSYQMFNNTSREAPAGFVKNVGRIVWLDDHHIAIGSNIFPEDG
ncbi:MAG: cadherin repeat domain-containing protein, partial [Betaproteobacteria bacterium]|nr:cadherin repeat domain-containing protein [Betaproteobacteria bacterium]